MIQDFWGNKLTKDECFIFNKNNPQVDVSNWDVVKIGFPKPWELPEKGKIVYPLMPS